MDTFKPPPPLLPDVISSPANIPPPIDELISSQTATQASITTSAGHFQQQKQQVQVSQQTANVYPETSSPPHLHTLTSSMVPTDESVVQMMMDCSMGATGDCSNGIQSNSISSWPPPIPSSSSSTTTFSDCPPPPPYPYLFPPSPPHQPVNYGQLSQPPQILDLPPEKVVEELGKYMSENDKVVLTNSICVLFSYSLKRGEACPLMSASPEIMNRLYNVLLDEQSKDDDSTLCFATGNLANISKYEEGRAAILGLNDSRTSNQYLYGPSLGVQSLIRSLQSRDSNMIIFAITAIHNLLLDRRFELQEIAKEQIKHGLRYIVQLLDNQCLIHNYEFKVIVLDCLQLLAYGNGENRLIIKESGGAYLLLRAIRENFDNHPNEELVETASRVLKSLSACPANKLDIIENDGINVLTHCIKRSNHEILKTCLWTLRNLSDVINNLSDAINNSERYHGCVNQLVKRLLDILDEYADEPGIITCALGILANLTCNNEAIKQFICDCSGVGILLNTIENAFFRIDKDVLEPAVCALCHLMNQTHNPHLAEGAKMSIRENFKMFIGIKNRAISEDLSKAVDKLQNLIDIQLPAQQSMPKFLTH